MSYHQQFRRYLEGFWAIWLLHVGIELGLFRELADQHLTPEDLAERLGYELTYTAVWCKVAAAYGFLDVAEGEGYRVSRAWARVVFGNGPWASTFIHLSQQVQQSLEAVFRGRALPESSLTLRMQLAEGIRFSYQWLWDELIPQVPPLHDRLTGAAPCRLVEFGCGLGLGLELARERFPAVELTGVEVDFDCAREAERASKAVVVVARSQDFEPQGLYDVAVFNRALATADDPRVAVSRAISCLKPGGFLVISSEAEIPADGELSRLRLGERFFYQMFITNDALRNLPLSEIERWCLEDGLELVLREERPEQCSPTLVLWKVTA